MKLYYQSLQLWCELISNDVQEANERIGLVSAPIPELCQVSFYTVVRITFRTSYQLLNFELEIGPLALDRRGVRLGDGARHGVDDARRIVNRPVRVATPLRYRYVRLPFVSQYFRAGRDVPLNDGSKRVDVAS